MKIMKYNFISNDQKDYPFHEKTINYLFSVISIIFFMIFNSMRCLNYNTIKILNFLIPTYEFLNIFIIFVIFIIYKVYMKKTFYNPNLLIPCNYFFLITSISLNFTMLFSIFNRDKTNNPKNNNRSIRIINITCYRFFLLSGILNSLFIFCITFLFIEKRRFPFKTFMVFAIAYGSLSLNLFVFNDFDAYWPNIHYSNYILYSFILIMLFLAKNKN